MKTNALVLGSALLAAFVVGSLFWRLSGLAEDIAGLRAQLAQASTGEAPTTPREAFPLPSGSGDSAKSRTAREDLVSALARISELERVANEQADTIDYLLENLRGMEVTQRKAIAPSWSALQATGPADSGAGDQHTAWAPAVEDGGEEWLQLEFAKPVQAAAVIVRENCAPGAIVRICAVSESGAETTLWEGAAPSVTAPSDTPFSAALAGPTSRVKVYLDTKKVPGWNEIDAVQLVGRDGTRQWAMAATASSSYGSSGRALNFGRNESQKDLLDFLNDESR